MYTNTDYRFSPIHVHNTHSHNTDPHNKDFSQHVLHNTGSYNTNSSQYRPSVVQALHNTDSPQYRFFTLQALEDAGSSGRKMRGPGFSSNSVIFFSYGLSIIRALAPGLWAGTRLKNQETRSDLHSLHRYRHIARTDTFPPASNRFYVTSFHANATTPPPLPPIRRPALPKQIHSQTDSTQPTSIYPLLKSKQICPDPATKSVQTPPPLSKTKQQKPKPYHPQGPSQTCH